MATVTKILVINGGVCGLALMFVVAEAGNKQGGAIVLMVEKERPGFSVG